MPQLSRCLFAIAVAMFLATSFANPAQAAVPKPAPPPNRAEKSATDQHRTEPRHGEEVVDVAMQYLGYRYVWGGASPASGFDCSGFVMFVFGSVGVGMPRDIGAQLASGPRVDSEDLMPGDLLAFHNTYKRGLSHSGIYVGDGAFVHAANEAASLLAPSRMATGAIASTVPAGRSRRSPSPAAARKGDY